MDNNDDDVNRATNDFMFSDFENLCFTTKTIKNQTLFNDFIQQISLAMLVDVVKKKTNRYCSLQKVLTYHLSERVKKLLLLHVLCQHYLYTNLSLYKQPLRINNKPIRLVVEHCNIDFKKLARDFGFHVDKLCFTNVSDQTSVFSLQCVTWNKSLNFNQSFKSDFSVNKMLTGVNAINSSLESDFYVEEYITNESNENNNNDARKEGKHIIYRTLQTFESDSIEHSSTLNDYVSSVISHNKITITHNDQFKQHDSVPLHCYEFTKNGWNFFFGYLKTLPQLNHVLVYAIVNDLIKVYLTLSLTNKDVISLAKNEKLELYINSFHPEVVLVDKFNLSYQCIAIDCKSKTQIIGTTSNDIGFSTLTCHPNGRLLFLSITSTSQDLCLNVIDFVLSSSFRFPSVVLSIGQILFDNNTTTTITHDTIEQTLKTSHLSCIRCLCYDKETNSIILAVPFNFSLTKSKTHSIHKLDITIQKINHIHHNNYMHLTPKLYKISFTAISNDVCEVININGTETFASFSLNSFSLMIYPYFNTLLMCYDFVTGMFGLFDCGHSFCIIKKLQINPVLLGGQTKEMIESHFSLHANYPCLRPTIQSNIILLPTGKTSNNDFPFKIIQLV